MAEDIFCIMCNEKWEWCDCNCCIPSNHSMFDSLTAEEKTKAISEAKILQEKQQDEY